MGIREETLAELRREYVELIEESKKKAALIREDYRLKAEAAIKTENEQREYEFANRMKNAKEAAGLTIDSIQRQVLRTKTWGVWKKWQELAGLESARVIAEGRRAQKIKKTKGWEYDRDTGFLTVFATERGRAHPTLTFNILENPPKRMLATLGGVEKYQNEAKPEEGSEFADQVYVDFYATREVFPEMSGGAEFDKWASKILTGLVKDGEIIPKGGR